jgi:hypothetical protein
VKARFPKYAAAPAIALLASAPLFWSGAARAQAMVEDDLPGKVHGQHSAQHFALELRVSPYNPDIDSDPALGGATPYKTVFGTPPRLFVGAELDWQVLRIPHFGSLGPGLSVGYTWASDPAQFTTPQPNPSGETTTLQILPIDLLAVLRLDVLWTDVGIPLVPYVKAGFGLAFWRASNTLGTSHFEGIVGEGHSIGWHVAGGLALNLNPFDLYAAQNFDDAMGVNNTYIFAEYELDELTGLGIQSDPLRVGGANWMFGLAFEF